MSSLATATLLFGMYSQFLPSGDEGQKLFQALSSFDLSQESQEALPSVTFLSGESLSDKGNPVINRVSLMERGDYDLWLMRQYISPQKSLPVPLPKWQTWAFVGILVDRSKAPATSYYFEFDSSPVSGNSLPRLIPFRASCSKCHSSGPRVIRPHASPKSKFRTLESKRDLLDNWNQKIAQYRRVQDFLSNHESKMFPMIDRSSEVLKLGLCSECHNSTTDSVRGPLKRKNADAILHLVKIHEMPLRDHEKYSPAWAKRNPISHKKLLNCFKHWTDLKDASLKVGGADMNLDKCVQSARSIEAPLRLKGYDQVNFEKSLPKDHGEESDLSGLSVKKLDLNAKVELSLGHSIEISGIQMKSFQLTCQKESGCSGVADLSLAQVSTGIELRDKHLKSWLSRNRTLNTKVYLKFQNPFQDSILLNQKETSFSVRSQVLVEPASGKITEAVVTIACKSELTVVMESGREWQCRLHSTPTFFTAIKDDQPCFLGVCVSPYIVFRGQFALAGSILSVPTSITN